MRRATSAGKPWGDEPSSGLLRTHSGVQPMPFSRRGRKAFIPFVTAGDPDCNYTPNGDGPQAKGRYPSLTLP